MAMNATLFDKLLKEFYVPGKLQSMLFKNFPLLERIPKKQANGKYVVQPVLSGANVRRSADYATAWTSLTEVAPAVAFQVPFADDYCISAIDGKLWLQSEGDAGSFISAFKQSQDAAMAAMRKSLAIKLWRNGSGSVANLGGSSTAATTQALSKREDAYNFEVGDIVAFSATTTDGGALRHPATGLIGAKIAGIQDNGTTASLVFTDVLNTSVTDVGNSDYIYINKGDAQNAATTPVCVTGVLGWSPASTVSLTVAFCGVTRSTDERRLRGQFVANTNSAPINEQLQAGLTQLIALGGTPKAIYLNPTDGLKLTRVAAGSVVRQPGGTAVMGFRKAIFQTTSGDIEVLEDPTVPVGLAFILDEDGMALYSLKEPIRIRAAGDSSKVRQLTGTTAWAVEMESFCNLVVERPGQCIATVEL